jgi:hypothetical protein
MKLLLCAVLDHKTKSFGYVQTHQHMVDAERMFQQQFERGDNHIARYPADFSLYQIGEYDSESGTVKPHDPMFKIRDAIDFVQEIKG